MEYVTPGNPGTEVSRVGLGTWQFGKETDRTVATDRAAAHDLLDATRDLGINVVVAPDGPRGQLADHVTDWYARENSRIPLSLLSLPSLSTAMDSSATQSPIASETASNSSSPR